VTVARLRARSLAFNATMFDITEQESADRRREPEGAGVKTARIAGSGIFKDVPGFYYDYFSAGTGKVRMSAAASGYFRAS
jgi:hypothetical protein